MRPPTYYLAHLGQKLVGAGIDLRDHNGRRWGRRVRGLERESESDRGTESGHGKFDFHYFISVTDYSW
jgi:hypothetical protein